MTRGACTSASSRPALAGECRSPTSSGRIAPSIRKSAIDNLRTDDVGVQQLLRDATEQATSSRTAGCPRSIGGVPQARRCGHNGSCRRDDPGGGDALWWPPQHHRPPGRWWPAVRAIAHLRVALAFEAESVCERTWFRYPGWPTPSRAPVQLPFLGCLTRGSRWANFRSTFVRWVSSALPRRLRAEVIAIGRSQPHHVLPHTGWVSCWIAGPDDAAGVIELFRMQYERYASARPSPARSRPDPGDVV